MVKMWNNLSNIFFFTSVLLIIVGTFKKVFDEHIDKEYLVIEKYVANNAKRCFMEEVCLGDETTIKYLVSENYITLPVDPVTKEYIDENIIIKYEKNECLLNIR